MGYPYQNFRSERLYTPFKEVKSVVSSDRTLYKTKKNEIKKDLKFVALFPPIISLYFILFHIISLKSTQINTKSTLNNTIHTQINTTSLNIYHQFINKLITITHQLNTIPQLSNNTTLKRILHINQQ